MAIQPTSTDDDGINTWTYLLVAVDAYGRVVENFGIRDNILTSQMVTIQARDRDLELRFTDAISTGFVHRLFYSYQRAGVAGQLGVKQT